MKKRSQEDSLGKANDLASKVSSFDVLPGDERDAEHAHEAQNRANRLQKQSQADARKEAADKKATSSGKPIDPVDLSDKDVSEYIKGEEAAREDSRIFKADYLKDNLLWEPYIDADTTQSDCVRISQSHRFSSLVNINNADNRDMQVIFNLLLLELAHSETYTTKQLQELPADDVEKVLESFRSNASTFLAKLCKDLDGKLPPYNEG